MQWHGGNLELEIGPGHSGWLSRHGESDAAADHPSQSGTCVTAVTQSAAGRPGRAAAPRRPAECDSHLTSRGAVSVPIHVRMPVRRAKT